MSANEQQLLDLWVNHRDAEAFKAIADRYAGLVYATCRRILGDSTEAQDVAQECFEALAGSGRRPGGYLAPWLHRVATTKSLQRIRSDRNRRRREEAFAPVNADPVADVLRQDLYSAVDEAIVALPEELRVPIVAHFLEDKTHEAIAADLGVSRQTVTYRIGKGIDLIRKRLSANAAFSVATLAGLLKPAGQTPPALAAAIGKLALAGPVVPFAGLATFATAKAIVAALAVVCAGGLALVYASRPVPDTGSKALSTQAALPSAPSIAAESPATPAAAAVPAPTPVDGSQAPAAAPSSSEKADSAAPADEPQVPPAPEAFVPHSCLEEGLEDGEVVFSARHFILSRTIRRSEFTDGRLIIFDVGNCTHLQIEEATKKATKYIYVTEDAYPGEHYHPIEALVMNAGPEGPKYVGSKNVDGKECNGFRADNPGFDCTLWIDRQTNLPVRMEGLQKDRGHAIVESEYDFDIDTDPERFSMDPPEGYEYSEKTVRDTWWSRLGQKAWSWWSWLRFQ